MTITYHRVTIHPIDNPLLDKLGIQNTTLVQNSRLGSVLSRLVLAGYNVPHVSVGTDDHGDIHISHHYKKNIY